MRQCLLVRHWDRRREAFAGVPLVRDVRDVKPMERDVGTATPPAAAPVKEQLDPIDRLYREHALQLALCDALESIADGLPDRIDTRLVREVTTILAHGMIPHFRIEEDVIFPLLLKRAHGDSALSAALEQLKSEHDRDADLSDELSEELDSIARKGRVRNAEMLGYMLRGYFEGQRRHIEWENAIVLPAARRVLTREDLAAITREQERFPRNFPRMAWLERSAASKR